MGCMADGLPGDDVKAIGIFVVGLFAAVLALGAAYLSTGCHPSAPAPVTPVVDAADGAPSTCTAACANEVRLGCAELPNCAEVLADTEVRRLIRTPCPGEVCLFLTCAMVRDAKSVADLQALGVSCGPTEGRSP